MQHIKLSWIQMILLIRYIAFHVNNNIKSLANKTTNFVNESHLLIWGKLQLGQTAQEPSIYVSVLMSVKQIQNLINVDKLLSRLAC